MAQRKRKVLIIDCDLHQGNGTAFIFKDKPDVFTFSMHQDNNYPFHKEKSDLDIPLPDGIKGEEYNRLLTDSLKSVISDFRPDYIIYVAGSDTYVDDQLGGIALSIGDLKKRDNIIKSCTEGIPIVVVLAGGYARNIEDTVRIHANTVTTFLDI